MVIIAHKPDLDPLEQISLRQCFRVLGRYPIRVVCPRGLDTTSYREVVPDIVFDFIDPKWQSSYANFNRLKILPFLYKRYRSYRFMLFYELDAFVFRDELSEWCARGYDYIGAPWVDNERELCLSRLGVGNGGFSLRRIGAMLRVTRSLRWIEPPIGRARRKYWSKSEWLKGVASAVTSATFRNNTFAPFNTWGGHEDIFWGDVVPELFPWYRLAPPEDAARFAFELQPRELYEANDGRLPFGCHAWTKYDFEFWKPHIRAEGYVLT